MILNQSFTRQLEQASEPREGGHERIAAVMDFPIVVHSHLRWSFVWQRPQQTHSRLAQRHRILFLEEPVLDEAGPERLEITIPSRNLWVACPRLSTLSDAGERVAKLLRDATAGLLGRRFSNAVHWLYTPMMEAQIDAFPDPRAIVYDCMDELSRFAHAPAEMKECEGRLLQRADVVFAGGYELGAAKAKVHGNVHVFGCGVDYAHFQRAQSAPCAVDMLAIPRPRLGYIGVIDERLDYDLLRALAQADRSRSIVLVGPIVKVNPLHLPQETNLFYLGSRSYDSLPEYLAGFDVCLMPFAMNEASYYINPTKTLEYLASGRPVLSTPIRDVVRQFRDVVRVSDGAGFDSAVKEMLAGDVPDRSARLRRAQQSSWERTVAAMESLAGRAGFAGNHRLHRSPVRWRA
ncbi:MAG TPA: glycosyltransferase [bacterium]|nr:glycosyltransferase [bacterium]